MDLSDLPMEQAKADVQKLLAFLREKPDNYILLVLGMTFIDFAENSGIGAYVAVKQLKEAIIPPYKR